MAPQKKSLNDYLANLRPFLLLKIAPKLFDVDIMAEGTISEMLDYSIARAKEWKTDAWLVTSSHGHQHLSGKTGLLGKKKLPSWGDIMSITCSVGELDPRYREAHTIETVGLASFPHRTTYNYGNYIYGVELDNYNLLVKIQSVVEKYPRGISGFCKNVLLPGIYNWNAGGGLFNFFGRCYDNLDNLDDLGELAGHLEGNGGLQAKDGNVDYYSYEEGAYKTYHPNHPVEKRLNRTLLLQRIITFDDGLLQLMERDGTVTARLTDFIVPNSIR